LIVRPRGSQLAVMVKNSFNAAIHEKAGPANTKKNGGLGLQSVQAVADRYGGELFTEQDEKTFTAYVLINLDQRMVFQK
jgi:hypothetical protein